MEPNVDTNRAQPLQRRVLLIANPRAASGQAGDRWQAWLEGLRAQGLQPEQRITEYPRHAMELARDAAGRYDVLVAVGGDGTVNEVAGGMLLSGARETMLGIVPFGTGNDVARLLGIETPDIAMAALTGHRTRCLDVIEAHCRQGETPVVRYALLYAAVGFAGEVLRNTTPWVKRLFGARYCYSVGFLRALCSYQAPMMTITAGERQYAGRFFHVAAGNAEYASGGTMRLSPGALMDDGRLDLCLVDAFSRLQILRHFPKLLAGTHISLPQVRYFPGQRLSIEADRPTEIALDGDLCGHTPAEFRVIPGGIRVLVP